MTGGAAKIHQPAFGKQKDLVAIGEPVFIDLRLDVDALHAFRKIQRVDLNLIIEMADVCDDRLVFHPFHVLESNDVEVAGSGDVNVAAAERVFDGGDFVAFHRSLRSEERRVGKECRSRWSSYHSEKTVECETERSS